MGHIVLSDGSPATPTPLTGGAAVSVEQDGVISSEEPMSMEEFISWAKHQPFLPDTEAAHEIRLGWNETIERAFRWCVTTSLQEKARENTGMTLDSKQPVKTWLEIVFKVLMSEPKVRDIEMQLGKLGDAGLKAVTQKGPSRQTGSPLLAPSRGRPFLPRKRG